MPHPGPTPDEIGSAARRLAAGGLVAFPTETVYGLGARADDDAAVAGIFAAKGRPADHPLIVHVADLQAAEAFTAAMPPLARRLAGACWPGPVTLIVPRRPGFAEAAAGGHATIGLRCPDHPVARQLLQAAAALGVPGVAGPSANRFGRISPTTAEHVRGEFGDAVPVLDGGPCRIGIESTIVDCSRGRPVLLRPGLWPRARLQALLGEPLAEPDAGAPRASGDLPSHYAPRARLRLIEPSALQQSADPALGALAVAVYSRRPPAGGPLRQRWHPMAGTAEAVAHELFAVLRVLDQPGVDEIWVERPPDEPDWEGVRDRLRRAAA